MSRKHEGIVIYHLLLSSDKIALAKGNLRHIIWASFPVLPNKVSFHGHLVDTCAFHVPHWMKTNCYQNKNFSLSLQPQRLHKAKEKQKMSSEQWGNSAPAEGRLKFPYFIKRFSDSTRRELHCDCSFVVSNNCNLIKL